MIGSVFAGNASLYFATENNVCRIHLSDDDSSKSLMLGPVMIGEEVSNRVFSIQDQGIKTVVASVSCYGPTKIDFAVTTFMGNTKKTFLKARQSREEQYRVDLYDGMIEKL